MNPKLLIVDDERGIVDMIQSYFQTQYDILTAYSGQEALKKVACKPDLILLDINMPGMDGLTVCQQIREHIACPILFLTARIESSDKIIGFQAGADDYIVKPFDLDELGARIAAHLRREQRRQNNSAVRFFGELILDYSARTVTINNLNIPLSKREFDKDIYGSTITVNLYKKLREVRKFNELSLLLAQIANDRTMALKFWGLKQASHTLHIDVNRHCVILEQKEVYLSTNEFEVLYLLQQSPQTTFTKEQIYEKIWHEPTNNHLHAVENTIFQIRKRLKPYCKGREYIKTVIGYGYKFNSG